MKIIFMGTPDFAVPSLKKLIEKHTVLAVVTQPDKPKGRGNKMMCSPVKEVALENNLPVIQPKKVRETEVVEQLRSYEPDLIVVVAFGQILTKELLNMPKYGCINVHGSLLPKYRGAGPIQWSVINGETVTGNTTMFMDVGIDTGDMLLRDEVAIDSEDTYGTLHDKMAYSGADLLIKTLEQLEAATLTRIPQNNSEATYAPMLTKQTGHIDWNKQTKDIINLIRGLNPWPSAYTCYSEETLKIWKACSYENGDKNAKCGEVVDFVKNEGFVVRTNDGFILVTEVQGQNGKKMKASDYLRGHEIPKGTIFE